MLVFVQCVISLQNISIYMLVSVQRANMEFTQAKSGNQSAASRETKLKDMATAYDSFNELKSNIDEGTKVMLYESDFFSVKFWLCL